MTKKIRVGVADTMFARGDMGGLAEKTLREYSGQLGKEKNRKIVVEVVRYTVPGIKDLPAACSKLFREQKCAVVIALGMVGGEEIDEQCALVADVGIQFAQLLAGKHVIGVMVYSNEARGKGGKIDEKKLAAIMRDRVIKHSKNALEMLFDPNSLRKRAGTGQRQGGENAGGFRP